jgi:hypothetical protein
LLLEANIEKKIAAAFELVSYGGESSLENVRKFLESVHGIHVTSRSESRTKIGSGDMIHSPKMFSVNFLGYMDDLGTYRVGDEQT